MPTLLWVLCASVVFAIGCSIGNELYRLSAMLVYRVMMPTNHAKAKMEGEALRTMLDEAAKRKGGEREDS